MTEIRTNPALLEALKKAASQPLTELEIREQRISFIVGTAGNASTMTRKEVEAVLAKQEGKAVAA